MDWIEICVHTSEEAVEAVSFFLLECGLEGVVVEDSEVLKREWAARYGEIISLSPVDFPKSGAIVKGYVSFDEDVESLVKKIDAYIHKLAAFGLDPGPQTITTRLLKKEDWFEPWKQMLQPIQITKRIRVKPVSTDHTVCATKSLAQANQIVIELEPGLAFGTGHHITTVQSLQLLEKYIKQGDRVIDVGCGSGILSVAAAKLGATRVLAIDLDPKAVEETSKHIVMNQLAGQIQVEQGNGLKMVACEADLVVANLIAELHLTLIADLSRVLTPGGIFIAAGILREKEDTIVSHLQESGFQLIDRKLGEDWIAIVVEK